MDEDDVDDDYSTGGRSVLDYASYEGFLESLVSPEDRAYISCRNMQRAIVEMGHRGNRAGYSEEGFLRAKEIAMEKIKRSRDKKREVISAGRDFSDNILLRMLQQREEANITGKQSSIILIRDFNEHGHEISGYIDFSHRLQTDDFQLIYNGSKRLLPRKGDLSFFNWSRFRVYAKNSPNYEVVTTNVASVRFRSKRDNKIVNVNPMVRYCGENTSRTVIPAEDYKHVIIFDHYNRKKC